MKEKSICTWLQHIWRHRTLLVLLQRGSCEFSAKSAQDNEGECAQVIMYNWSYFYSVDPLTWSDTVLRHSVQNDIIVFHHVFKLGLLVVYGFISTQTSVNRWGLGNVSQLNHTLSKTCQPLYIYIYACVCVCVCMYVCMYPPTPADARGSA